FSGAVLTGALATLFAVQGPRPADARAAEPTTEEAPAAARTYVGAVEGAPRSARVGVVADGADFVAYVCSQDDGFNKAHSHWLKGKVAGNRLSGEPGGLKIAAELKDDKVEGSLTADGKTLKFSAAAVEPGGPAALYRAEDTADGEHYVLGWVIDADGAAIGNQRNTGSGDARALKTAPPPPAAPE